MKKLLAILGSLTVSATSALTIVSCKDKTEETNVPPTDSKEEIRKLISKFESEVNTKWASVVTNKISEASTFVEKPGQQSNFTFFQKEKLKDVYEKALNVSENTTASQIKFYDTLDTNDKEILTNNIQSLLSTQENINNLKKEISASTYQVLIGDLNSNWIDNVKMNYDKATISFTDKDMENSFLANIEVEYETKYYYMDAENARQTKSLQGSASITISDDGAIIEVISKLQQELAADLLKTGNPLVYLDKTSLNDINAIEIIGGSTNKYKNEIEKYYEKFAPKLVKEIKKNYFDSSKSPVLKGIKVDLQNPKDVIRNSSQDAKVGELKLDRIQTSSTAQNFKPVDEKQFARQSTYFGEIKQDASILLGDDSKATDSTLYSDLKTTYEKTKDEYAKSFKLKYEQITEKSSKEQAANIESLLNNSVNLEQVSIKGINFQLANGYKQNLNDVLINLSVAVDNKSTLNENKATGKTFAAYYNGISLILDQFHKFYGTSPSEIDQISESSGATKQQLGLLFYMNGSANSEFNIWDYWKGLKGTDKDPFIWEYLRNNKSSQMFTNALNLDTGDVQAAQIRNESFISNLIGTKDFKLDFSQRHSGYWSDLYRYSIDDKKVNKLEPGIKMSGLKGYWGNYQLSILTDLFSISAGTNSTPTGQGNALSDADVTFTFIGKKSI
ncbi:lipoprotein [Mesoplasma corruscae]|uniref:Lipoprotein n=1 Tax=Mesoplasma corruscae TaxID=216874 RepID=A0A2S5RG66_9MOLU|nr:lipoprotein [Mesoplasma corruscae]PPE06326.1 hypothetical protein MCORR_v1c06310 [Mesoplasma corruscae]